MSSFYLRVKPEHEKAIGETYAPAWADSHFPMAQYETIVRKELEDFRAGKPNRTYEAFLDLLKFVPEGTLLDVGASSGYYSEVLRIRGLSGYYEYQGIDYSTYYKDMAEKLFPGILFHVGSAMDLPFEDKSFDLLLHGACLMHVYEYEKAIQEAARVAKSHIIFHRTPIFHDDTPTEMWVKLAYGIPCAEWHFSEKDIVGLFYKHGLEVRGTADIFIDKNFGHRSYLAALRK